MKLAFPTVSSMVALLLGVAAMAFAQGSADETLAETATVKLTRADYDAELQRVPAELRAPFATDRKRVTKLLENLLVGKTLAGEARKAGLDKDPLIQRRIALEAEKILAEVEIGRIEQAAAAEFDAKAEQYLLKARERYVVDKEKFRVPEQVSVSHILFETRKQSPEAALALAREAQAKLAAGAEFAAVAKELSEDQATKRGGGKLGWFAAGDYDAPFSKAAFDLKKVGDVSAPVLAGDGYHLIRLEGRRPERVRTFDEVKDQLMAELRQGYVNEQRDGRMAAIRSDPTLKVNEPAINALIVPMPDASALSRAMQEARERQGK